jgi:hypothetical protein
MECSVRFEVAYPAETWAVMPDPQSQADDLWLAEQRAAYAGGPLEGMADRLEGAAREALRRRRIGIDTSLYFRPAGMPVTGVLHAGLRSVPSGVEEVPAIGTFDWMLPDAPLLAEPVVADFETEHVPHVRRMTYVTTLPDGSGGTLAGLSYGLVLPGVLGLVFSELAHREVIGLMQPHADPLVGSLAVVA